VQMFPDKFKHGARYRQERFDYGEDFRPRPNPAGECVGWVEDSDGPSVYCAACPGFCDFPSDHAHLKMQPDEWTHITVAEHKLLLGEREREVEEETIERCANLFDGGDWIAAIVGQIRALPRRYAKEATWQNGGVHPYDVDRQASLDEPA
jgi:hypothetical protein